MIQKIHTAGEVATILSIPYHRLDYYERRGIISKASRTSTNQRLYTDEDIINIKRILQEKGLIDK